MVLAKNITALILALLLANPACCCSWMMCGAAVESAPAQSCCGASSEENGDKDSDSEKHECLCSLNTQYVDQGKLDLPYPDQFVSPEPPIRYVQDNPIIPAHIAYLPQSNRPPPGPAIRLLYSVFRL